MAERPTSGEPAPISPPPDGRPTILYRRPRDAIGSARGGTLAAVPTRPLIVPSGASASDGKSSAPSDWTLTIASREMSFLRVDHQTRLQLEDVEIVIEGRFMVHRDGTDFELDPADRQALGPVLALYPTTLAAASIDADGTLRLVFDNGAIIAVPPDPSFEPWGIIGPGSARVVCMPGTPGRTCYLDLNSAPTSSADGWLLRQQRGTERGRQFAVSDDEDDEAHWAGGIVARPEPEAS